MVIEILLQYIATEFAIRATEQQMLVPDPINDFGWRDMKVGDDAEVDKLPIFLNGAQRKTSVPAELARNFAGKRIG